MLAVLASEQSTRCNHSQLGETHSTKVNTLVKMSGVASAFSLACSQLGYVVVKSMQRYSDRKKLAQVLPLDGHTHLPVGFPVGFGSVGATVGVSVGGAVVGGFVA